MLGYLFFFSSYLFLLLSFLCYIFICLYIKTKNKLKLISKVSNSSKAKEADPTMNDIERNTLLLLCAMFHVFLLCPWYSCRRRAATAVVGAVALQLLSAAVRGSFQGLAHRSRAKGHDHSVMASRIRCSATVARQSPSVNVPRPVPPPPPSLLPVGGMFRSMERISVEFNCTPDQMSFFLNSWLWPSGM